MIDLNVNELKEDIKELHNLESQPNVESDSILYERLEYLRWKVDKARQYLMKYSIDIDWTVFDSDIKSTIKRIKDLSEDEKDHQIELLFERIVWSGFPIDKDDLIKYMYYLNFFECLD